MIKRKSWLIATLLCTALNLRAHAVGVTGFILPTRYYDAAVGRFISADDIVQAPTDPQSLNRYAYVRNNPMNNVDPTGHSWLSKSINKAGNWIGQHKEFAGLTFQAFDPFLGSAYLASFDNGRAILAGQAIAAASFGVGGPAVGWGAVSGELSSAYIARRTGGNMLTSVIRGGLEGAAISGAFSGIGNTNANWVVKGMGKSAISAGLAKAHGADPRGVWTAAGLTFGAEAANAYFTRSVGYGADPTPGVPLDSPNHSYPIGPGNYRPPAGTDVFGSNDAVGGGFWHQGSPAMRAASAVPGMQSVSQIHDTWMNAQHVSNAYLFGNQAVANIITMPPAFVTSYAAQFSGPWAPVIIYSQE
ncbi:MAG: hypothetical protein KCHDKBKB_01558 [Elusimicrobia bacterium]|nr:hypothetical protein [Elusimicrobiota bacterium]